MIYYDHGHTQISSTPNNKHILSLSTSVIQKPGFIYVYLSYESASANWVYFDDLNVVLKEHPVIQSDDYYPFGLTFNSYQRSTAKENKWKFQGQEHIKDLDLNWVSFKWRNHDPAIGRFFNVDPLAEDYYYNSPYAFSENKVVAHVELEGLESWEANDGNVIHGPRKNTDNLERIDNKPQSQKSNSEETNNKESNETKNNTDNTESNKESIDPIAIGVTASAAGISAYENEVHDFKKYKTPSGQKRNLVRNNGNTVKSPSALKRLKVNTGVKTFGVVGNIIALAPTASKVIEKRSANAGDVIDMAGGAAAFLPGVGWKLSTGISIMRATVPLDYDPQPSPTFKRFGE